VTRDEARTYFWKKGIVAPCLLRPSQLDMYDLLKRERRPFIECSRRFGKTFTIMTFVMEQLKRNPGWICRWCEPQKDQARKIVMPIIDAIQDGIPEAERAEYNTTDSVYKFPNGSKLFLLGVNEDRGKSARGPAANIIVLDEYGFWVDAKYIAKSILYPQLQNQEGQWFIKASTPPPDLGHIYYEEKEEAIRKGRFIQKLIYDNEALSEQELKEIIEEAGGVDTPTFRREYLCEPISNPDMLVVPEWSDDANIIADDYARPEFFTPYVGGDSGADDNTAILFGYYDFVKNERVIERELVCAGRTTKQIISDAKAIEFELWGDRSPKRRVYDAPKQLIYDIFAEHKWPVEMPPKDDKTAAIHALRVEVGARRLKVKESCVHTIRQLKVGMWKDEKHLDFQRTEGLGHLDAIAALIYLNRIIDPKFNPIPQNYGLNPQTHFIPPRSLSQGTTEDQLSRLFKKRGFR
jgi:hypothetical protein